MPVWCSRFSWLPDRWWILGVSFVVILWFSLLFAPSSHHFAWSIPAWSARNCPACPAQTILPTVASPPRSHYSWARYNWGCAPSADPAYAAQTPIAAHAASKLRCPRDVPTLYAESYWIAWIHSVLNFPPFWPYHCPVWLSRHIVDLTLASEQAWVRVWPAPDFASLLSDDRASSICLAPVDRLWARNSFKFLVFLFKPGTFNLPSLSSECWCAPVLTPAYANVSFLVGLQTAFEVPPWVWFCSTLRSLLFFTFPPSRAIDLTWWCRPTDQWQTPKL